MAQLIGHLIRILTVPVLVVCGITLTGCVSTETHTKTLSELNASKKTAAQQAAELEALKQTLAQESAQRRAAEEQIAALAKEREALRAREQQLNGDLSHVHGQMKELEQKLAAGNASAQDEIIRLQQQASELEAEAGRIAKEREQLLQEQSQLTATLEQERTAKESEIARLTRTQEELSRSLQDEITKGNISIQQVRDQLTINMVDRVLFDSGQAQVKASGVKVLKQVGDVLNKVSDKQIRIEGHTDNLPISAKLQDKFKSNWELSTARATNVVRYLIDQGGVNRQQLSAVGYAETRPIASNDNDQGRSSNRRIEIVLYPKNLKPIAGPPN